MIEGINTALITPLKNETVDLEALKRLVDRQVNAGVHGLVLCATTGEGSVLTDEERNLVVKTVVDLAKGKVQIVVGTGRVSTWATIESNRAAADLGADAALVVSPAYVRPSQDGIVKHFEKVADDSGIPIIVYNVPSRTASDVLPAAVGRMAAHDNIVGIKEATGSVYRAQQVIAAAKGRMSVLSGDDPITLSLLVAGGQGVICTASNAVPEKWVAIWNEWKKKNIAGAAAIQAELADLHEVLFLEANPGPVKAAAHLLGLIEPEIRLPLLWPSTRTIKRLAEELEKLGYTKGSVT